MSPLWQAMAIFKPGCEHSPEEALGDEEALRDNQDNHKPDAISPSTPFIFDRFCLVYLCGCPESAGLNRFGVENERVLQGILSQDGNSWGQPCSWL